MAIGIERTVACTHCGWLHDITMREDTRGVRCANCERVFYLDEHR